MQIRGLLDTAPGDRGDVSDQIRLIGDQLAALTADLQTASARLNEYIKQNEKLLTLNTSLHETMETVSIPPLGPLIDPQVYKGLQKSSEELNSDLAVTITNRRDLTEEIKKVQNAIDEASGHIKIAGTKLENLRRLDSKRLNLINGASEIIGKLFDPSFQSRFSENPIPSIEAARNKLSDLNATPRVGAERITPLTSTSSWKGWARQKKLWTKNKQSTDSSNKRWIPREKSIAVVRKILIRLVPIPC